jgi:hypothetical protein
VGAWRYTFESAFFLSVHFFTSSSLYFFISSNKIFINSSFTCVLCASERANVEKVSTLDQQLTDKFNELMIKRVQLRGTIHKEAENTQKKLEGSKILSIYLTRV